MITILDLLSKNEKEKVIYQTYKAGEIIFNEGEKAIYLGIVIHGAISIDSYSSTGNLINYNTIMPGEMFGNNLLFSNDQYYLGNVKARTKTTIGLIKKEDLLLILMNNRNFLSQYLQASSNFTKQLNSKVKILSLTHTRERLLYYINNKGGKIYVPNVSELARNLGLSREATSRTITELIKENKIKRIGNSINIVNENNN